MLNLFCLRIQKVIFCLVHVRCWAALRKGVAPAIEHRKVLRVLDCDLIIDVGGGSWPVFAHQPIDED
jgi:hypothetical protein